jgi:two-component system LytT family response regulator
MNHDNYIRIPTHSGSRLVMPEQIMRVQSCDNYSTVHFIQGKPLVVAKLLIWFEGKLPEEMFARVHRSHLVNRQRIIRVEGRTGSKHLLLDNGEAVAVSRRRQWLIAS